MESDRVLDVYQHLGDVDPIPVRNNENRRLTLGASDCIGWTGGRYIPGMLAHHDVTKPLTPVYPHSNVYTFPTLLKEYPDQALQRITVIGVGGVT